MLKRLEKEITNRFKIKYEKLVSRDFKSFYEEICPLVEELYNSDDKDLAIKNLKNNNIRMTKIRWVKKLLSDSNNNIANDINSARIQYNRVLSNELSQEKFKDFFGAKDITEYTKLKLGEIELWKSNEDSLLTDYKYIDKLNIRSLKAAFKNDILLTVASIAKEEGCNKAFTKVPSILSEIPIDTTSRIDFLSEEQKKTLDEAMDIINPSTIDKLIMFDEEDYDEILFQLEKATYLEIKRGGKSEQFLDMMTQIALLKSVKYLNATDVKVIRYYYTHFEKMVLSEPIDKTIYQIVSDLGMPNRPQYYEMIENSIAKLSSMKLSYTIEGNQLHGNFLGCLIYEDEGIKRAKVYLGQILNELLVKKSTFEYDEETFNLLSADAQQLAIWFQKRRYRAAINNTNYNEKIALSRFATAIYWNTKRADRQRNRITEALKELKDKNLIIKEFSCNKRVYEFTIEYIPLSPRELSKLENHSVCSENVLKETEYKLLK